MKFKKYIHVLCVLSLPFLSYGQEFINNHWHFGVGMDLDFSTYPPSLETSNIFTSSSTEPASISDQFGNILAYSDGNKIYNDLGDMVDNGQFSIGATENIFAPIPGEEDRYYLFRSGPGFVDYSIVDLSAFGGQGYIDPVEKQTEIHLHQSQLMITSHANQIDMWLIMIDNNSGLGSEITINTHLITSTGIQPQSSYSNTFIFATWYNNLEEARISPNCNRIATSYKGHYIVMFDFDNLNGDISEAFPTSVSLPDSFGISDLNYLEFSPSGDNLYVIQDHETITRFDALTDDPALFLASGQEIPLTSMNHWSHIKRGRDSILYLLDTENLTIDAIVDPDQIDISNVIFQDSVLALSNSAEFFPNTFTACVTPQVINTQNICEDSNAGFNATGYGFVDSLFWDVDLPFTNDTLFFSSSGSVNLTDPGTYEVIFNYLIDSLWYQVLDSIVVYDQPFVNLGQDQVLCDGDLVILEAGSDNFIYEWSTGSFDNEIEVSSPGLYSVLITNAICSASDEVIIDFLYEPIFELSDSVFCGSEVDMTIYALTQQATNFIWSNGSSDTFIKVNEAGIYWVTASNDCFSTTDTATIETVIFVDPLIDPQFQVCGTDTLFVLSNSEFGTHTWSNGQVNDIAGIIGQGSFTLTINENGCEKSASFEVERLTMASLERLIFPNVFTPNGDEMNAIFRPFDPFFPSDDPCLHSTFNNELIIYNRWGNELQLFGCSWTGEESGTQFRSGVYYYVSKMTTFCLDLKKNKTLRGSFELIRE